MSTKIGKPAFDLLKSLAANNDRAWYHAHKAELNERVRAPFGQILQAASLRLSDSPVPLSGGPATMFRQHRDTRFSKDKRPLKTNVSGMLTPSGSKNRSEGLVYLHLEPGESFVAAGFYQFSPAELRSIRQRIVEQPEQFERLLQALDKAGLSLESMDALKKLPRGFEQHADHGLADYLRYKSFIVRRNLAQALWTGDRIVDAVVDFTHDAAPLLRW